MLKNSRCPAVYSLNTVVRTVPVVSKGRPRHYYGKFQLRTQRSRACPTKKRLIVSAKSVGSEKNLTTQQTKLSDVGLIGLAVMGQNLALNVAEKGFQISVYNRSFEKTELAVKRAEKEGLSSNLVGYKSLENFVNSLEKPRRVFLLVKAGPPVDATIEGLIKYLEPEDIIIDGGNEWFENTERRMKAVAEKGIRYIGCGVSGGEEGARNGPSMMPGGSHEGYQFLKPIVEKIAAQVDDGPCVTYVGPGGAGNYVKMVHNGIEYGDMQLISEAYDILRNIGGLGNEEIANVFEEWNRGKLNSFLVEISSSILRFKDDHNPEEYLVDKILDKTGMKGTGKWTVQQAAEMSIPAPTIEASLNGRFLAGLKEERVSAAQFYLELGIQAPAPLEGIDKAQLVKDVEDALYASKICSYAQGMNIIRAKSQEMGWDIDIGGIARIWKGGCIIRAGFLDLIKEAYVKRPELPNLLVDPFFGGELAKLDSAWRRVVCKSVTAGLPCPGFSASLGYYDSYRCEKLPANLIQAQRDYFGSHTYQRVDSVDWYHTVWSEGNSGDSITTNNY
uniref:6-phosphogluconate dehydrogenase, decarboxylating n=1 Tax=Tetraselmis sp. GSL018 TaxID=582737 RepID=A0A061RIG1_9CHLO